MLYKFLPPVITLILALPSAADSFPFSVPTNHIRVMAWNLEFFNSREPARTSQQLDDLAARIIETEAAIIALQEMNEISTLNDLRNRMGNPWAVLTHDFSGAFPQQNALLYDTSKVSISDTAFVNTHGGIVYPEEWTYRSPVTAIVSPVSDPTVEFRIIGIHGSWQNATFREAQGEWLADYVDDLVADQSEPDAIILLGDYNGKIPDPPHASIVAGGDLTDVPKRNGDDTTIYVGLKLDFIYGTQAAHDRVLDQTSFVIRPEYYGENGTQFKDTYSDHLPVFVDYRIADIPAGPTNTVYVDFAHYGIENGASTMPWDTLLEALQSVDSGGTINIKGNTDESNTSEAFAGGSAIASAVTLDALNGAVSIGGAPADAPMTDEATGEPTPGYVSRP